MIRDDAALPIAQPVETLQELPGKPRAGVRVSLRRDCRAAGQRRPETSDRWEVAVDVHGQWDLSSTEGLRALHAQAFVLAVGSMALHPYSRSHVQHAVVEAGYPPYTLEVLRSLLVTEDDIDLDVVDVHDQTMSRTDLGSQAHS